MECCPLCHSPNVSLFHRDWQREYRRCDACSLIFVPSELHLTRQNEKAQYDLHENTPDDPAYRGFLNRLFEPVQTRIEPCSRGLDFGSGPGPTLSVMFEEAGHSMSIYDPFFAPDRSRLSRPYDFVTASEVVEHFRNPADDIDRLWSCVRPGGLLGIMTKRTMDREAFARWHYKNDPTHVSFYSSETFHWLAATLHAELTIIGPDVVLFRKNSNHEHGAFPKPFVV